MKKNNKNGYQFSTDELATSILAKLLGSIKEVPIEDAIEEYLAYIKTMRSLKTVKGFETFKRHLLKFFSPIRIVDTITQKDIEGFLLHLQKSAPRGVYNYYRVGRAFFNCLLRWNHIRKNPFAGIELPKRQYVKPAYYNLEEAEKIWKKLEEMNKPVIRDIVKAGFFTGARYGELSHLKWRNVDQKERLITIGDHEYLSKTRATRTVPLNEAAYEVISALYKNKEHHKNLKDKFVFCKSNNAPYSVDCISKNFKKAVRELGMDESIHLYSTRHSAASHLVSRGANLYAVKEILGHTSFTTTQRYAHLGMDDLRKAVGL